MPDFSTTTESDKVVAAVLMMGAMQKYFSYFVAITCGIPSVTLLGEREDWASLVKKLDKLYQLGNEPARFAQLLRPVLNHFVVSFVSPGSTKALAFWGRCAHRMGGSGTDYLSGWISAFCFWNEQGELLYFEDTTKSAGSPEFEARNTDLGLDDVLARSVDIDQIPSGFISVPLTMDDDGKLTEMMMLAGSIGIQAMSKEPVLEERTRRRWASYLIPRRTKKHNTHTPPTTDGDGPDSIQPFSGWLAYMKKDVEDGK